MRDEVRPLLGGKMPSGVHNFGEETYPEMNIGIDLGGTNIAAAAVGKAGEITKRAGMPTAADRGADTVIERLLSVCETLTGGGAAPDSIGIGVPGSVDSEAGAVVFTPNLPLSGVNIAEKLREKFGCPVHLGNDANCAALGETVAGGAKGAKDVVFITLGTGVGGGIVLGGRLHAGANGSAGELGHMVTVAEGRGCGCGRKGCWERYASATGFIRTANEFMESHPDSLLWESCGGAADRLDGRLIFAAYRAGDHAARLTVERYVEHLTVGIVNIINIFEPELLCIGGGISNEWDCFAGALQAAVDAEKYTRSSPQLPQTRIVRAALGNDAGIIGAAMLGG